VILDLLRERLAASAQPRPDAVLLVGRGPRIRTRTPICTGRLGCCGRRPAPEDRFRRTRVRVAGPPVGARGSGALRGLGAGVSRCLPFLPVPGCCRSGSSRRARGGRRAGVEACGGADRDCDALADLVLERYARPRASGGGELRRVRCTDRAAGSSTGWGGRSGARPSGDPAHRHAHRSTTITGPGSETGTATSTRTNTTREPAPGQESSEQ